jgi:hypothetical protein
MAMAGDGAEVGKQSKQKGQPLNSARTEPMSQKNKPA